MTMTLEQLTQEVEEIKQRNKQVEQDKAWETSYLRKTLLVLFTYLAIGFYLEAIDIARPWLNAIVPAVAFFLSTLTMPLFKKWWSKYFFKR